MKEKELEKILESFHRVKAPHELDKRLTPYFSGRRKRVMLFRIAIAFALLLVFGLSYHFFSRTSTSNFLYEPLHAAVTVPGYFETSIKMGAGEKLRIIFDSEILKDTIFSQDETYLLKFETERGLHYLIIEISDASGNEKLTKTIDIYSL